MATGVLRLKHIPINQELVMPVVISSFEMDVSPKWSSSEVYGRMDPIFTYQNTVRKFTAVVRTPGGTDQFTDQQYQALLAGSRQAPGAAPFAADDPRTVFNKFFASMFRKQGNFWIANKGITELYLSKLADLYKMMYPLYDTLEGTGTGFMTAAPLMELGLEGMAYSENFGSAGASSLSHGVLFVPETFKVTSLMEEKEVQLAINDVADMRFYASAKGYTITLGGTVLHRDNRVGFQIGTKGNVIFGQGANFPYNTQNESQFDSPTPGMNTRTTAAPTSRTATGAQQRSATTADNWVLLEP